MDAVLPLIYRSMYLLALLCVLLAANNIPGFIHSYQNNVESALTQAIHSNSKFHPLIDEEFGGNPRAYLNYLLEHEDEIVRKTASPISSLFYDEIVLLDEHKLLNENSIVENAFYLLSRVSDTRVRRVWKNYNLSIDLSGSAIVFTALFTLVILVAATVLYLTGRLLVRKLQPATPA